MIWTGDSSWMSGQSVFVSSLFIKVVIWCWYLTRESPWLSYLKWIRVERLHSLKLMPFCKIDDNAHTHRARIIWNFLQAHGVEQMQWPAVSPDLNPIENLWDQLGRAARKRVTSATSLAQLQQILIQEWNAIPQDRVRRLVSSLRRCQTVVGAYGDSTRY